MLGSSDDGSGGGGGGSGGTVTFRVFEASTGDAIPNVTIGWNGEAAPTNADGHTTFGLAGSVRSTANGDYVSGTLEVRGNGTYRSCIIEDFPASTDVDAVEIALTSPDPPAETVGLTVSVTYPETIDIYHNTTLWILADGGAFETRSLFNSTEEGATETFEPEAICPHASATVAVMVKRDVDGDTHQDSFWTLYRENVDLTGDRTIAFDLNDASESFTLQCDSLAAESDDDYQYASVSLHGPVGWIPIVEFAPFHPESSMYGYPEVTSYEVHFNNPGSYEGAVKHRFMGDMADPPGGNFQRYATATTGPLSGTVTLPDLPVAAIPSPVVSPPAVSWDSVGLVLSMTEHTNAAMYAYSLTVGGVYTAFVRSATPSIQLPQWLVDELGTNTAVHASVYTAGTIVPSTNLWAIGMRPGRTYTGTSGSDAPYADPPVDSPYDTEIDF